jgi:opacity protein-like surface antigen
LRGAEGEARADACARPRAAELSAADFASSGLVPAVSSAAHRIDAVLLGASLADASFADAGFAAPRKRRELLAGGDSYTILRAGAFFPDGDISSLDTGSSVDILFGTELLPFLGLEISLGYLGADGGASGDEFWAIPAFVNARASVPILVLEPYAGAGVGGMYADYQVGALEGDDFVAAWNAFLGVAVGLSDLAVGAEYRYLQSEEADDIRSLEGSVVAVFGQLPF